MALLLEDVSADMARAFAVAVAELRENHTAYGEPILRAKAVSDLNGDSLPDCVVLFGFTLEGIHGREQFLSLVLSSAGGYRASWPVGVGVRGYREFQEVEIDGTGITLRGDFTVADGSDSMAHLSATGEVYFLYEDGRLFELGGWWLLKSRQVDCLLTTGCSGPWRDKVPASSTRRPAAEPGR
jgi:hypothetical protein